jgi:hypothetical protein
MVCLVVPSTLHVRYWQHRCVPSSSTRSRVWQTWRTHRHGSLDLVLSIDLPPRRLPRRVTVFVYDAFSYAPLALAPTMVHPWLHERLPRLQHPRLLRRPRLPYARHPRPWLFTLVSATSTSAQRAIICMRIRQFSLVKAFVLHQRYVCGGMSVRWFLPSASSPAVCSTTTMTAGEY